MLPGVQTVQMYFKAELWAPEVDPGFEKKNKTDIAVSERTSTATIFKVSLPKCHRLSEAGNPSRGREGTSPGTVWVLTVLIWL